MHLSLYICWNGYEFGEHGTHVEFLRGLITATFTDGFDAWYLNIPRCEVALYAVHELPRERYVCSCPHFCVFRGDKVVFAI